MRGAAPDRLGRAQTTTERVCIVEIMTYAGFVDFSHLSAEDIDKRSFRYLGSGVSREVYAISDTLVIKMMRENYSGGHEWAGNNEGEIAFYNNLDDCDKNLVAKCFAIADDGSWLISERVAYVAEEIGMDSDAFEVREQLEDMGMGDLHPGNMGQREDGTWCAIDYAFSGGVQFGDGIYSCDCFVCECQNCFPEGCGCETFDGCKMTRCEMCSSKRRNLRNIVDAQQAKMMWSNRPYKGCKVASRARNGWANIVTLPTIAVDRMRDELRAFGTGYAQGYVNVDGTDVKMCADCIDEIGPKVPVEIFGQGNLWDVPLHINNEIGCRSVNYWHGPSNVLIDIKFPPLIGNVRHWDYYGPKIFRPIYVAHYGRTHLGRVVGWVKIDGAWVVRSYSFTDLQGWAPIVGEI